MRVMEKKMEEKVSVYSKERPIAWFIAMFCGGKFSKKLFCCCRSI